MKYIQVSDKSILGFDKLIRFTYQTMCDSMNSIDLTDTPEDLLSYAEQKLQELINSEKESE